jgi:hypothetical protein
VVLHSGVYQSRTYTAMTVTLHLPNACFKPWHRSIKTSGGDNNHIDRVNGPQGPEADGRAQVIIGNNLMSCHSWNICQSTHNGLSHDNHSAFGRSRVRRMLLWLCKRQSLLTWTIEAVGPQLLLHIKSVHMLEGLRERY